MKDLILFSLTTLLSIVLSRRNASKDTDAKLRKALEDGTSRDAQERVCTVNEHNVPTLSGHTRAEMRLKNLWHRATYIIVRQETTSEDHNMDTTVETYLLVQRRSQHKDYCPGKLDPTPGGVVGFQESYEENATRELEEEMGINVSEGSPHTMTRLFSFPYQDSRVRVWGDLYEAVYYGSLNDLRIQEEEVEEVLCISLSDVRQMVENDPDDWMPDALHALRLYLQYREDRTLNRRLLRGYSSGNLDAYGLRPKPRAIFFDCDDCLYFDDWNVANILTAKINDWCVNHGLAEGEAYGLYKKHGTALRGLLAEGLMEHSEENIDRFLREVHDIPIATMLARDETLREIMRRIDPSIPKYVFTASVRDHAERCLQALGIDDLFVDIIDVKSCNLATKHSREAFDAAMVIAGVDDPESCLFFDDSITNIYAARQVGWRSILVGRIGRDCGKPISTEHAELEIDRIHDMPSFLPELFGESY